MATQVDCEYIAGKERAHMLKVIAWPHVKFVAVKSC